MSFQKIHWVNGLKIDQEILNLADNALINTTNLSNCLPYNLSKGVLSFEIDYKGLETGIISVKDLQVYLDNQVYIYYDKKYSLDLQVTTTELAALVYIYVNVHEVVKEYEGREYIYNKLSLSMDHDFTAKFSIKISSFRFNNGSLEPLDTYLPILSMNHYLMDNILHMINKMISNIKSYDSFVLIHSRPNLSMYLNSLVGKLERNNVFMRAHKISIHPYIIFDIIHDIYSLLTNNINYINKVISFSFNNCHHNLSEIILNINNICSNKSVKNNIQFEKQAGKYVCDILPLELLNSESFFFVIKRKDNIDFSNKKYPEVKKLKITSMSRYTQVINLSLSGLALEEIDYSLKNSFTMSLGKDDKAFQIKKSTEWDFILSDKSIVFTAIENCEYFDFFITFK